ncbi:hypothetical protein EV127DRAFT_372179 [Xylaria flabelliformis]|nr:hypothetical protein EV127DRAFT_372179 [Xylaria flabelliformis]
MAASAMTGQMGVVPAQLGFLAIFNPSLGATDETLDDQIVYYASINTQSQKRRHRSRDKATADISQEERNERLRQIGLAQGMVEFSRGFANGQPVNTIETEKTRVVLQEVEPGWWILASIDLTRIPLPPRIGSPTPGKPDEQPDNVEYSSRELKPSTLLMRDLIRAHSVFLIHHAASLSALFVKSRRSNFVKMLSRFWDLFISTWDVMLHGNPASNVFRSIKIAACGELGVGVGEENRGSGEREVLEGFVGRIEGLTDLVVSRFGSSESASEAESAKDEKAETSTEQWLGTGEEPGAEDGAVFLGVGALSRKSLRDITYWMEDIYTWGEDAYGVKDSPTSTRQARRRRKFVAVVTDGSRSHPQARDKTTPPNHDISTRDFAPQEPDKSESTGSAQDETVDEGGMNKFMSYLKMGYGTHWSLGSSEEGAQLSASAKEDVQPAKASETTSHELPDAGNYLIGLLGDMEESNADEGEQISQADDETETSEYNSRILLRTLTVELDGGERVEDQQMEDLGSSSKELFLTRSGNKDLGNPDSQFDSQDRNKTQKMRVVVYVNKPFIFTFLFRNRTDSLAWEPLYRSLHHQLAPLRKPLAMSTAYRPSKPEVGEKASHIFDLVWDPKATTIHSTIPNIPTPAEMLREDVTPVWSRAEAVNTHNQILNMYTATLNDYSELERTCKTSRGWWVVWTRILERDATLSPDGEDERPVVPTLRQAESQESDDPRFHPAVNKEIFLIRRAGEHSGLRGIASGSYAESVVGVGGGGWAEGASRLAQGIGVDTHKYIEGLLNMGR